MRIIIQEFNLKLKQLTTHIESISDYEKNLKNLRKKNILYLISHKSKYPILGKKINLRKKALEWMKQNDLYGNKKVFNIKNIFFEEKFLDKIKRIKSFNRNTDHSYAGIPQKI